jgi:hypothetical protein
VIDEKGGDLVPELWDGVRRGNTVERSAYATVDQALISFAHTLDFGRIDAGWRPLEILVSGNAEDVDPCYCD